MQPWENFVVVHSTLILMHPSVHRARQLKSTVLVCTRKKNFFGWVVQTFCE